MGVESFGLCGQLYSYKHIRVYTYTCAHTCTCTHIPLHIIVKVNKNKSYRKRLLHKFSALKSHIYTLTRLSNAFVAHIPLI